MIVGIGELLWDIYPDGRKVAGGAPFNFAFHCTQLGHEAVILSRVGDDDLGRELRDEVRRLGMSEEFIQIDREHPTGTVQVAVGPDGQPSYAIAEDVAWDYIEWDSAVEKANRICRAVSFGTLAQRGPISLGTIDRVSSTAGEPEPALAVCDLNLRQSYFDRELIRWSVNPVDWIRCNLAELETVARLNNITPLDFRSVADRCFRNSPSKVVIVTHGAGGCSIVTNDNLVTVPGVPARVVDTVGAGDAFTAAMVCLHLEGRSLRECARFANHYAARVCEHRGAIPRIDRREVEQCLHKPNA
jgi:fructokinase